MSQMAALSSSIATPGAQAGHACVPTVTASSCLSTTGPGSAPRFWYVAYPDGATRRFTNDLADYRLPELDTTADGKTLAAIEQNPNFDVDVVAWPSGTARQVTTGGRVGASRGAWTIACTTR